jgi:putative DNA methylase
MINTAPPRVRKKLIEVSLPLEAINAASAREKSIRHGHPSTLHLWWSRKPLATCRAVLFAQLVDDPSSWPERFPTEELQEAERRRLHKVIAEMMPWEASNDERILNNARWEIARSVAWGLGESPPPKGDRQAILDFLRTKAPPIYDPFSGGGSIPLEAQRLGLRAYGSDLNPVAVLIGKALVEIPPKFAGRRPINPAARKEAMHGQVRAWKGAQGLADDFQYYGKWMRDEAEREIGDLYPQATMPDGSKATVIAWLWAHTVRSPDPSVKGARVPLLSSFLLSTKPGRKVWVEAVLDPKAEDGYRFEIRSGQLSKSAEDRLGKGTIGRSEGGRCILTGASMPFSYVRTQGQTEGLGIRLVSIVAESSKGRIFLPPTTKQEKLAAGAKSKWEPDGELPDNPRDFKTPNYGLNTYASLFSPRQMATLTTFSDLVAKARVKISSDIASLGEQCERDFLEDTRPLHLDGKGAAAYADAIATYLSLSASKMAIFASTQSRWRAGETKSAPAFARQALPMMWGFAEINPFAGAGGDWLEVVNGGARAIAEHTGYQSNSRVSNVDAQIQSEHAVVISTDPPYYDNIGYADLSDYFYVWLRASSQAIWPELFRRLLTPKSDELVATPYRHGGIAEAESFFMIGMKRALQRIADSELEDTPTTIYYAFKQSEIAAEGITSAGWSSFLQAVIDAGMSVVGTWPIRTEGATRLGAMGTNSLASSVVLVCRKREKNAVIASRADFIRALKRDLPDAIDDIRKAGVGPVDMQQSVIGPGMGVFSRYAKVLEDDDSAMPVKTALSLINRVWEEIDQELDAAFDAETQVALAWFATYGFDARASGELITLANAKNIASNALFETGVFKDLKGKTALTPRDELPKHWTPASDKTLTVWECVQHTARVLNAEDGGGAAAGRLVAEMGPKAAEARALAYRLFEIATQKGWASEALIYNELAQEWPKLEDIASNAEARASTAAAQPSLF